MTKMTKTTQTVTSKGVDSWIRGNHGKHGNDENHENPGCKTQVPQNLGLEKPDYYKYQKGLEVCYCPRGVPSRPSPGSYPGPVQVPSRVRGAPVQIRHVLCFPAFRTHPGPEVGAIPARPGPILLPSVPYRIRPGRAETDFLATSENTTPSKFTTRSIFTIAL